MTLFAGLENQLGWLKKLIGLDCRLILILLMPQGLWLPLYSCVTLKALKIGFASLTSKGI